MRNETFVDRAFQETTRGIATATQAATAPAHKIWKRWNRRDPQTGAPEGVVAIMKDRMFAMVLLRRRKTARPYRRLRRA